MSDKQVHCYLRAVSLRGAEDQILTSNNDNGKALLALIDRTETVSKQVLAFINLNAVLLREVSMAHHNPLEHFAKLEAELKASGKRLPWERGI